MSVIEQLERDLVTACERQQSRKRTRPPAVWMARFAVTAAFATIATLMVVTVARQPDIETPAQAPHQPNSKTPVRSTAAPKASLRDAYAVFRSPPTATDKPPANDSRLGSINASNSRLLAHQDGIRVYAAITPKGQLCSALLIPGGAGSSSCGKPNVASTDHPLGGTTTIPGQRQAFLAIVPDSVKRLRLTLADGTQVDRTPRNNAVLLLTDSGVRHITTLPSQPGSSGTFLYDDPSDPTD